MGSGASKERGAATAAPASAPTSTARGLALASQTEAALDPPGADLVGVGGLTAATVGAVGDAVQAWNAANGRDSTVIGLVSFVKNAVPGLAATLGALGEHAPLVVVVVSVLKVAGAAYVTDDTATLKALYEQFAGTVFATTRLVLAVHEFQQANHVTLPGTVTSALDIYWQQLDKFAALLVQFRGTDYAKRLFAKGAHQAQLRAVQRAVEQAASDLNQTGILTSAVQSELILRNSADGKATLRETYALAKERQDLSIAAGHVWVVATLTGAKFVGREAELATLQEQLRPSKDTATCVVISGTVGTGKSTLAQRAAETCRARFSSGWTLDGSKKEALLAGLSRVARDLQLGELKPDEVAPAVQSRLNKADVAGWLVIVDNVDDAAMKARLPALLPSQGGCLLVTSRLADWDGWTQLALGKLSEAEATQLLGGSAADAAPVAFVVQQLDGLAVALEQARACVTHVPTMTWAKYVDLLAAQAAKGVGLPSLQLSLQAAMGQNPSAAVVLQLLQVLHPADIPRSLLKTAVENAAPGADADELLALLSGFSIIALTETTVATHRLMQEAMRAASPCEVKAAVALGVVMNALEDEKGQSDYDLMRKLIVHYGELLLWMERNMADSVERAAALTACGAIYTYSFSDPAAIPYYESALVINEHHYGPDAVEVATTLTGLGNAYGDLGDAAKQKELLERALAIKERHGGPSDPSMAQTLMALGNAYISLGNASKAKELYERSLVIKERHYGTDHVQVAITLTNLGNACGDLGDPATHKVLIERALAIIQRDYGPDHPKVATTLASLGNSFYRLGDFRAAIDTWERALAIYELHYGPDHPEVSTVLTNLGNAYGALGDAAKQKVLLECALANFERHFGPDHATVAQVLISLGSAYGYLGDAAKQKALLERALPIMERQHGPNHELVAQVLASLGNAYGVLGDIDRLTTVYERATAIWKGSNLENPRLIGQMLRRLEKCHETLGHTEKALEYRKQSIAIEQQLFPAITAHRHPLVKTDVVLNRACDCCLNSGLGVWYQCRLCGYDECPECFLRSGSQEHVNSVNRLHI